MLGFVCVCVGLEVVFLFFPCFGFVLCGLVVVYLKRKDLEGVPIGWQYSS